MKQSTNNSASLSTPLVVKRGAKKYTAPKVGLIELDNEISLAMESSPPIGPDETLNSVQTPFKEESVLA